MKLLFVCTGNICRSPLAEGLMRQMLADAGLGGQVTVASAGTSGWHEGEPPHPLSRAAAAAVGVDISEQRARVFRFSDFEEFDLILAMDRSHLRELDLSCPPGSRARLALFLNYAPDIEATDVPDPYGEGADAFEAVRGMIGEGCAGLLAAVRAELG